MKRLSITVGKEPLAVVQLHPNEEIPNYGDFGSIWSIIRTPEETTLIVPEKLTEPYHKYEKGWRYLKIEGSFDFDQIGILTSILNPLADGNISVLTFSTYNTDYILIKSDNLDKAIKVLTKTGHEIKK